MELRGLMKIKKKIFLPPQNQQPVATGNSPLVAPPLINMALPMYISALILNNIYFIIIKTFLILTLMN